MSAFPRFAVREGAIGGGRAVRVRRGDIIPRRPVSVGLIVGLALVVVVILLFVFKVIKL